MSIRKTQTGYSRIYHLLNRIDKKFYNDVLNMTQKERLKLRTKLDNESISCKRKSDIITEVFRDELHE